MSNKKNRRNITAANATGASVVGTGVELELEVTAEEVAADEVEEIVEQVEVQTPASPDADHYFGTFFDFLKSMPAHGSSEFATGPSLFALATAINAKTIIEIGRYTGFSTVALAGALRFLDDAEWRIPDCQYQRPDVNYKEFLAPAVRKLISVDLNPNFAAELAVKAADLERYVQYINADSHGLDLGGVQADMIFVDGDHTYEGCLRDVEEYIDKYLRPGGYYVLHDYYGWYNEQGENGSAIKRVVDLIGKQHQNILIDTGFMSLVLLRKPK